MALNRRFDGLITPCRWTFRGVIYTVFPAMAVINVLYINMYKIKKMLRKYIFTLLGMLGIAALFNYISVICHGDYVGISFATMLSYYVWLIYSQKDFEEISIDARDYFYLIGFFGIYYASKIIKNDVTGFVIYGILITVWNIIMYRDSMSDVKKDYKRKS